MIKLTEGKLNKLRETEDWDNQEFEEFQKSFTEDPIYVWGEKDRKEVFNYLKEKGCKWEDGKDIDEFDPGWTWGYPVVIFITEGCLISYTPVNFGRDVDEEPSLD